MIEQISAYLGIYFQLFFFHHFLPLGYLIFIQLMHRSQIENFHAHSTSRIIHLETLNKRSDLAFVDLRVMTKMKNNSSFSFFETNTRQLYKHYNRKQADCSYPCSTFGANLPRFFSSFLSACLSLSSLDICCQSLNMESIRILIRLFLCLFWKEKQEEE